MCIQSEATLEKKLIEQCKELGITPPVFGGEK
jgi:hypothetical protein